MLGFRDRGLGGVLGCWGARVLGCWGFRDWGLGRQGFGCMGIGDAGVRVLRP